MSNRQGLTATSGFSFNPSGNSASSSNSGSNPNSSFSFPSGSNTNTQKPTSSLFSSFNTTQNNNNNNPSGSGSGSNPTSSFSFPSGSNTNTQNQNPQTNLGIKPQIPSLGSTLQPNPSSSQQPEIVSTLKNQTLEEIVNEWNTQLKEHTDTFTKQALQVSEWDKQVLQNTDLIFQLNKEVNKINISQKELNQHLDTIYSQQMELDTTLDTIEKEVNTILEEVNLTQTDQEREKGYQLAEDINGQLIQMSKILREITKKVNASAERSSEGEMSQIMNILNSHLSSLKQIDQNTLYLENELARIVKTFNK